MEIQILPQSFTGDNSWHSKMYGCILVQNVYDIDKMFNLLVEQDQYWANYKHLIKVAPISIPSENSLKQFCEYVGKTDIYDIDELRKSIDFIIYQYVDANEV